MPKEVDSDGIVIQPAQPSEVPAPRGRRWKRPVLWLSALAGMVALAALALSRFQPLYVLNPTRHQAQVTVSGQSLSVAPGGRAQIYVAEGEHQVQVRLGNGIERTSTFVVSNTVAQRFFRTNLFAYVVLGAQALVAEDHYYSGNELSMRPPPPLVFAGREFYAFRDVEYPFAVPPDTILLSNKSGPFHRRRSINVAQTPPETIIREASLDLLHPKVQVRPYAEGLLRGGDHSPALVDAYWEYCLRSDAETEAERFLAELGLIGEIGARTAQASPE